MSQPRNSPLRLVWIACACLVVASLVLLIRQQQHRNSERPAAGTNSPQSQASDHPDRTASHPERTRNPRPVRGGAALATGGSDAVAALVGDTALTDAEVITGLRRIVDDGSRKIDERLEALDHVLNLVSNKTPDLLRDLATRKVMPDEVRLRLAADALNRPQHLQGEVLVALLVNAAGDARKKLLVDLSGLCGENCGDDLAGWRAAVDKLPADP